MRAQRVVSAAQARRFHKRCSSRLAHRTEVSRHGHHALHTPPPARAQVFDAQGAADMAAALLAGGRDAKAVTNRLINEAVRVRRCKDNCSVALVVFE